MTENRIDSNSGVQANVGFDFQRNTCIYIFLENYHRLQNQDYFIMLEHYDDIVFGYLSSDGNLSEITTYQAKKSSSVWTTNSIFEIIHKITKAGIEISNDRFPKSKSYTQTQHFITNNTIALDYTCSKEKTKKKEYINETNETIAYINLNNDCQKKLKTGNSKVKFDKDQLQHFDNLNFTFIDLGRNTKSQLDLLTGKFKSVFGNSILDHTAARDTLIYHLKEIESTYNQRDFPKLSDKNKKIDSSQINAIINILTTKNLALEFCRKKVEKICEELLINVIDSRSFELDYENSLDQFKDLKQGEHQKILQFIERKKGIFRNHTNDIACIKELYDLFITESKTTLSQTQLKASISAGYFLILMQK
ncbi:hypothetical protein [Sphingobacterium mizutaii]|uniref:hypothetical protein n=2 Tax=Bacteroidota TaxID=976 RepID=UPI00162A1727|nr:hypothetical protein [Sphingobacterium mizutaii]